MGIKLIPACRFLFIGYMVFALNQSNPNGIGLRVCQCLPFSLYVHKASDLNQSNQTGIGLNLLLNLFLCHVVPLFFRVDTYISFNFIYLSKFRFTKIPFSSQGMSHDVSLIFIFLNNECIIYLSLICTKQVWKWITTVVIVSLSCFDPQQMTHYFKTNFSVNLNSRASFLLFKI